MKYWLIEIIRNTDILCNIVFFVLTALFVFTSKTAQQAREYVLTFKRPWLWSFLGVMLIPSKDVLYKLF